MKLLLTILFATQLNAQAEVTLSVGAINALTDVGGNKGIGRTFLKDFQPVEIHPMFSISFGKTYGSYLFSVKFLTGALSGADSSILEHTADASQWRRVRGYYFKTDINELTVSAKRFYGPLFLSVGGGAYYTQNIEPVLTYGGGIRLGIVQLTIEGRKLFTDYLDGVSDKPYSKGDDSYVSVMIGIVLRKRKINDWECPKWE